jgi:hypothetical protein
MHSVVVWNEGLFDVVEKSSLFQRVHALTSGGLLFIAVLILITKEPGGESVTLGREPNSCFTRDAMLAVGSFDPFWAINTRYTV